MITNWKVWIGSIDSYCEITFNIFFQNHYLVALFTQNLLLILLKSLDLVMLHVQLTPQWATCVSHPVPWLMEMQHVQQILLGITLIVLKYAHLLVSGINFFNQGIKIQ